jgi:hypothetical protein
VSRCNIRRPLYILRRHHCRGCPADERKSQPGGAQRWYCFRRTLTFRSLLRP